MPRSPRPPRRPGRRLPPRRRRTRRRRAARRTALAGAVFAGVAVVALLLLGRREPPPQPRQAPAGATAPAPRAAARTTARPAPAPAQPVAKTPLARRAQDRATPPAKPVSGATAARRGGRPPDGPRAALLIDDLGQNPAHLAAVANLDLTLSVAVLPGLPFTARTVREARRLGIEVLLHLPMEPRESGPDSGPDPGPGALLTSMAPSEIAAGVREALAAVPGAVGVNNHMGSRFTEDRAAMSVLMDELRARRLFWLDSRTTVASAADEAAVRAGVPAASRDVFIDAEVDPEFIRGQLRKLVALARRRGTAIGIGHPHPETIAALVELRDELAVSGVAWVPVSALVGSQPPREARRAPASPPARRAAAYPALAADGTKP